MFIAPERKNIMGLKFCPNCGEVVVTKALSKYSQRDYKGVLVKRLSSDNYSCSLTTIISEVGDNYF
jgi:hypothetical protein